MNTLNIASLKDKLKMPVQEVDAPEQAQSDRYLYDEKVDDAHGGYYRRGDYTMRDVPEKMKKGFETAYKAYPKLQKGSLEAIAMMESSMGTDDSKKGDFMGTSGYLMGFQPATYKDRMEKRPERYSKTAFDLPEESVMAAANLYDDYNTISDSEGKDAGYAEDQDLVYIKNYSGKQEDVSQSDRLKKFKELRKFYSTPDKLRVGEDSTLTLTPETMKVFENSAHLQEFKKKLLAHANDKD